MVYQHFTLVPNMTVAENLVLARADAAGGDRLAAASAAQLDAFLDRMPFRVPLDAPVSAISPPARSRRARSSSSSTSSAAS